MSHKILSQKILTQESYQTPIDSVSHYLYDSNQKPQKNFQNQLLSEMKGKMLLAKSEYLEQSSEESQKVLNQGNSFKKLLLLLLQQIKLLKEEKQNLKEQIQFEHLNFSFIIELASQNIVKHLKTRLTETIDQKNQTIFKLSQRIQQFEEQEQDKEWKKQSQKVMKIEKDLQKLNISYERVLAENLSLRKKNKVLEKRFIQFENKNKIDSQYKSYQSSNFQKTASSQDVKTMQQFKVKKRRTHEDKLNVQSSRLKQSDNMKSLDRIKSKIRTLKNELLMD